MLGFCGFWRGRGRRRDVFRLCFVWTWGRWMEPAWRFGVSDISSAASRRMDECLSNIVLFGHVQEYTLQQR